MFVLCFLTHVDFTRPAQQRYIIISLTGNTEMRIFDFHFLVEKLRVAFLH